MSSESSSAADAQSAEPKSPVELIVKKLGPGKELIAIIIFFGGGVLWLVGYFETKAKVKELRCFAHESIWLTRSEILLRTTYEEESALADKVAFLDQRKKDGAILESENSDLKRYNRDLIDLKEKRKMARDRFNQAEKRLLDSECSIEDSK